MSSLLHPIVLESFRTGLKKLQSRIFINSLTVVPQYLPEASCPPDDSAVFDSDETGQREIVIIPVESSTKFVVPVLSPVTAHMSDYESRITPMIAIPATTIAI